MRVSTVTRREDTSKFRQFQMEEEANWKQFVKHETIVKVCTHIVFGIVMATAFLSYLHVTETCPSVAVSAAAASSVR